MNLTELELSALRPDVINLSDGHARQSLGARSRVAALSVFEASLSRPPGDYFAAETQFLGALTRHTGQRYLEGRRFVTYASSVAMGIVATHLKQTGRRVGLVYPTFDNISGILRTLNVPLVPVPQRRLYPECDLDHLTGLGMGALVLVAPNNPTGARLSRDALCYLLDWAATNDVQLVLDLAFRWFDPGLEWDVLAEADRRGTDVVTIDDTGKVVSLADVKVGVLAASRRLAPAIRRIHTQYVLNVSELTLRLLTVLMDVEHPDNEVARARQLVRTNRRYLARRCAELQSDGLSEDAPPTHADGGGSAELSVAWLDVARDRDGLVCECRDRGLEILAGDYFYWADPDHPERRCVRLALLRDAAYFADGVDILIEVLAARAGRTILGAPR